MTIQIKDLTEKTTLDGTEELVIQQLDGVCKKVASANLGGSGGNSGRATPNYVDISNIDTIDQSPDITYIELGDIVTVYANFTVTTVSTLSSALDFDLPVSCTNFATARLNMGSGIIEGDSNGTVVSVNLQSNSIGRISWNQPPGSASINVRLCFQYSKS